MTHRQAFIGGKDWFSQSGLPDDQMATPYVYARRLTRYIADPSTVRVRTLGHFGRAPGIETIRAMRHKWVEMVDKRAMEQDDRPALTIRQPKPTPVDTEPQPVIIKIGPPPEPLPVAARGYMLHTATDVIDACADAFGISYGELIGTMRNRQYTRPRNLCIAVLRARGNSYPNIGRIIGGRDHSTIVTALHKFFAREIIDPQYEKAWMSLAPCVAKACRSVEELNLVCGRV